MDVFWNLYNDYKVGKCVDKKKFRSDFLLNGECVCLSTQTLGEILKKASRRFYGEPMNIQEIVGGDSKFKFFMNFRLFDNRTDLYVAKRVYDAFDSIRFSDIPNHSRLDRRTLLMSVTFASGNFVTMRFPHLMLSMNEAKNLSIRLGNYLTDEIVSWWNNEVYEKDCVAIHIPYTVTSGCSRDELVLETIKSFGVGKRNAGRTHRATHFSRSHRGLLHFSMDSNGLGKLLNYVGKMYQLDTPTHFNEIISTEDFRFFIECDWQRVAKPPLHFAICIQDALWKLSEKGVIPRIPTTDLLQCLVFDASNETKTSIHIRFVNMYVNKTTAKEMTSALKSEVDDEVVRESIDCCPVSGAIVQLRMPFCDKPDKNNQTNAGRPLVYRGQVNYPEHFFCKECASYDDIITKSILNEINEGERTSVGSCERITAPLVASKIMLCCDGEVKVLETLGNDDHDFISSIKFMYLALSRTP